MKGIILFLKGNEKNWTEVYAGAAVEKKVRKIVNVGCDKWRGLQEGNESRPK